MLRFFALRNCPIHTIMDEYSVNRHRVSHVEYIFVNFLNNTTEPDLVTSFNHGKKLKRFCQILPDAYTLCGAGYKIWFVNGCHLHGEPK